MSTTHFKDNKEKHKNSQKVKLQSTTPQKKQQPVVMNDAMKLYNLPFPRLSGMQGSKGLQNHFVPEELSPASFQKLQQQKAAASFREERKNEEGKKRHHLSSMKLLSEEDEEGEVSPERYPEFGDGALVVIDDEGTEQPEESNSIAESTEILLERILGPKQDVYCNLEKGTQYRERPGGISDISKMLVADRHEREQRRERQLELEKCLVKFNAQAIRQAAKKNDNAMQLLSTIKRRKNHILHAVQAARKWVDCQVDETQSHYFQSDYVSFLGQYSKAMMMEEATNPQNYYSSSSSSFLLKGGGGGKQQSFPQPQPRSESAPPSMTGGLDGKGQLEGLTGEWDSTTTIQRKQPKVLLKPGEIPKADVADVYEVLDTIKQKGAARAMPSNALTGTVCAAHIYGQDASRSKRLKEVAPTLNRVILPIVSASTAWMYPELFNDASLQQQKEEEPIPSVERKREEKAAKPSHVSKSTTTLSTATSASHDAEEEKKVSSGVGHQKKTKQKTEQQKTTATSKKQTPGAAATDESKNVVVSREGEHEERGEKGKKKPPVVATAKKDKVAAATVSSNVSNSPLKHRKTSVNSNSPPGKGQQPQATQGQPVPLNLADFLPKERPKNAEGSISPEKRGSKVKLLAQNNKAEEDGERNNDKNYDTTAQEANENNNKNQNQEAVDDPFSNPLQRGEEVVSPKEEKEGDKPRQTRATSILSDYSDVSPNISDQSPVTSSGEAEQPPPNTIWFYKSNEVPFGCFANFLPCPQLQYKGRNWQSVEHAFQAMKFEESEKDVLEIWAAETPKQAASMGRDRARPKRAGWSGMKDDVMYEILLAKFTQNLEFQGVLLNQTENQYLEEHSPKDDYWGSGKDGQGQNMMGKLLMKVRDTLREEQQKRQQEEGIVVKKEEVKQKTEGEKLETEENKGEVVLPSEGDQEPSQPVTKSIEEENEGSEEGAPANKSEEQTEVEVRGAEEGTETMPDKDQKDTAHPQEVEGSSEVQHLNEREKSDDQEDGGAKPVSAQEEEEGKEAKGTKWNPDQEIPPTASDEITAANDDQGETTKVAHHEDDTDIYSDQFDSASPSPVKRNTQDEAANNTKNDDNDQTETDDNNQEKLQDGKMIGSEPEEEGGAVHENQQQPNATTEENYSSDDDDGGYGEDDFEEEIPVDQTVEETAEYASLLSAALRQKTGSRGVQERQVTPPPSFEVQQPHFDAQRVAALQRPGAANSRNRSRNRDREKSISRSSSSSDGMNNPRGGQNLRPTSRASTDQHRGGRGGSASVENLSMPDSRSDLGDLDLPSGTPLTATATTTTSKKDKKEKKDRVKDKERGGHHERHGRHHHHRHPGKSEGGVENEDDDMGGYAMEEFKEDSNAFDVIDTGAPINGQEGETGDMYGMDDWGFAGSNPPEKKKKKKDKKKSRKQSGDFDF